MGRQRVHIQGAHGNPFRDCRRKAVAVVGIDFWSGCHGMVSMRGVVGDVGNVDEVWKTRLVGARGHEHHHVVF